MKKLIIISVLIIWGLIGATETSAQHGVSDYFYTGLHPHGSWIEIDYGVVVWRPTIIRRDWSPYREGRWIWTADGWYWDSYEPFGYITYHYGRWFYDDYYGWLWYPDYEWAPAWVEWRYSNDYIGWAPLHPYATFSITIGIFFSNVYYVPYHQWHFVTYRRFCDPYVYNYYIGPKYKYRVYNNTRDRTNYKYYNGRVQNRGVDVDYVRVRSGQEIRERDVIRVRDPKKLRNGTSGAKDEIRILDVSRDQLSRRNAKTMDIKKERRKTSLDVNKVELNRRDKTNQIIRDDKVIDKRIEKRDINKEQKEKVRKDVEKKVVKTKRDKVDKQKTEIKKERVVKNNKVVEHNNNNQKKTVNLKNDKTKNQRQVNNDNNKLNIEKKTTNKTKHITPTNKNQKTRQTTRDKDINRNDNNKNKRPRR